MFYRFLLVFLTLPWIGCEPLPGGRADRLEVISGDNQAGNPDTVLGSPLVVRVLGERRIDAFGRRRERLPLPGQKVTFDVDGLNELRKQLGITESEAPGNEFPLLFTKAPRQDQTPAPRGSHRLSVFADGNGIARVYVKLGTLNGDWRIEADVDKNDVHFRVVSGINKSLSTVEAPVGTDVDLGLTLRRWVDENEPLTPLKNREIVFRVVGEPKGAEGTSSLRNSRDETNNSGTRRSVFELGDRHGRYQVLAEITPHESDVNPWRGILFSIVATDWLGLGLRCFVGIVLLMIGVRLLGNGFLLMTGALTRLPTGPWARNRVSGFLGGTVAGAVFQSAPFLVSYLASLANSGLLKASSALGLILGVHFGATLLCQILAFDVAFLSVPLLVVGTGLFLARKRTRIESWSWVFLGSGLLLVAWTLLDETIASVALSKELGDFTRLRDWVEEGSTIAPFFLYLLLATGASFLFRTSNLVVILTMLLATHQLIPLDGIVGGVLGANLGAAIMVFLLNLHKRREAQRLALLNLFAHLLGVLLALGPALVLIGDHSAFLRFVDGLAPGHLLAGPLPGNVDQHVAMAHSAYTAMVATILLAFPLFILRPTNRLLPSTSSASDLKPIHLDENLISVPTLALRQTTSEVIYMTEICRKSVAEAFDAFRYDDLDLAQQVVRRSQVLSDLHRDVSRYLVHLAENQLVQRDVTQVEILQSAAESISRISNCAELLRELTARKIDEKITGSEEVARELGEVYDLVLAQFDNILKLLEERDIRTEESAVKMVERLAKYSSRIETHWRQRTVERATTSEGDAELDQGNRLSATFNAPVLLPVSVHVETMVLHEAFSLLFRIASALAQVAERMRILAPQR